MRQMNVIFRLMEYEIQLNVDGKKSFVWQHFGYLRLKTSGKRMHEDQVHCIRCFVDGNLKSYKETVSTSNLAAHLRDCHSIFFEFMLMLLLCISSAYRRFIEV
jgi:hypothetical protein